MKPLFVLLLVSLVSVIILKFTKGNFNLRLSARIGMSAMLLFTTLGHFMFPEGMALMIPDFIPFKKELVYITAVMEIFGAIGLHINRYRKITAWLLILFFIVILPANINAAINQLDYQTAAFNGPGLNYLWFRVPLQLLFIAWVYLSSIKINAKQTNIA